MSLKIDRVQLDIVINNDQARVQLRKLEEEARMLTREMNKLDKTSQEYAEKSKRLMAVKQQMDNIYNSIGIANMTMKELTARQKELNAIMLHLRPGTMEYKNLKEEVDAVGKRIGELKGKAKETDFSIGKIADGFNRYFAFVTAGLASLTGLIFSLRKAVDVANLYEKRVDNLSALTGLMGRELEYLSDKAKELSTSTIEGNIRITKSADAIVDAYTKVGSKRPELLKVKEDLNAVTQEALILAAAADGELEPAVAGLTMVLNQFNLPATESRRIINVLAAGSKEGAGEVDYLTAGFEKAGSVASSFNISIEELTGTLETLAPRMTEPEMAGRSLRNIMLFLETQSNDKLKPSLVGLTGAFEELNRQQTSVAELVKLVGQENINAANILMKNTTEMNKYTKAVTDTNVALEQASINTDNNASKLDQARNRVQNLTIEFGQKLAPAMAFSTNAFGAFMRVMLDAPGFVRQYNVALIALGGALLAYNGNLVKSLGLKVANNLMLKEGIGLKIKDAVVLQALIVKEQLATIWKGNGTVATKLATTAQYAWNAAMKANPIGLLITAVTALVVAIKTYDKYNAESVRLEKEKQDAVKNLSKANDSLQQAYDLQGKQIEKLNTLSLEQKQKLAEQTTATLTQAEAELTLAKAKQQNIIADNTRTTLWQTMKNALLSYNNPAALAAREATDAVLNGIEAGKSLDDGINKIADSIKNMREQAAGLNDILNAEQVADSITGKTIAQLEEKQRLLTTALKNYEKGSAEYIRIAKKLSEVNKQLQSDNAGTGASVEKAKTEYEKLQDQIKKATEELVAFVMAGKEPPAEFINHLKDLEQKLKDVDNAVNVAKNGFESYIKLQENGIVPDNTDYFPEVDNERFDPEIPLEPFIELENRKKELLNQGIEGAKNLLFAASQAQYDHDMALMDKKYDAERTKLERQLDDKVITREQYDAKVLQLDKKRSAEELKLRRKQAIREKEIASLGIAVDAARAIFEIKAKAAAFLASGNFIMSAVALAQIPWVLGAAALQAGLVWAQPMPQAYTGRGYDVTGAMDNRQYKNVPYVGTATTGTYLHPTLIADHGSEIVIDHARSRNIQMNYPELMAAIRAVPQHYTGRIAYGPGQINASATQVIFSEQMITAMNRFSEAVSTLQTDGVHLDYQRLKDMQKKETAADEATAM